MPQMNKGGKWVFGWCVVGSTSKITISPAAYTEYGFQPDEPIVFLRGSHRSGGFSVGRLEKLADLATPLLRRSMGQGDIQRDGQVAVPPEAHIQPGERLLSVHGSGYAVLFCTGGPIYEEALKRSDIETLSVP